MIIGVIGSGSIGPDLAYGFVSALAREPGSKVYLVDIKKEALDSGVERIRGYAKKGVARGKLSAELARTMDAMLVPTMSLADLADCEYVLEAASEDLPVKQKILSGLEQVVKPDCLVGFATSGLPRARIAAEAKHPQRCFVNHPFFPAWRSLPVEVVLSGDSAMGQRMMATMKKLGKVPIITADAPCFAADDVFCNYISEAVRIVAEGIATPAQVDAIVNDAIGGGGPFNVMDLTRGNLLTVHCQELMREAPTGSDWFAPPALLSEQGNQAWHDRKNPCDARYDEKLGQVVLDRILAVLIGRTYFIYDHEICAPTELDWLLRMSLGFSKGLLSLTADLGADRAHELCTGYAAAHPCFEVPASIAQKKLVDFRRNVLVEKDGGIGVVRVFRPEVKNALSAATIAEIDSALDELSADASVTGVIFTSYDGALAGADIGELAALPTPDACRDICLSTHPVQARMEAYPVPLVAAVDGAVMGGGAEFCMACHARVVGPSLQLAQPEVNLGIIPGYGGTQRLPRLIGLERANDLLRTGRAVRAADACAWGWANGEPTADVMAAARALIAAHNSGAVKLGPVDPAPMTLPESWPHVDIGHRSLAIDAIIIAVMRGGLSRPLSEGLTIEAEGFGRCKQTVDMDIGMKNFIQNGPRVPAAFMHE